DQVAPRKGVRRARRAQPRGLERVAPALVEERHAVGGAEAAVSVGIDARRDPEELLRAGALAAPEERRARLPGREGHVGGEARPQRGVEPASRAGKARRAGGRPAAAPAKGG